MSDNLKAGETTTSPTGIKTAWIPAGTFTMGSPDNEIGRGDDECPQWKATIFSSDFWGSRANEIGRGDDECPQRQVTISSGFWMGVYPVTQEEWERVTGSNPSYFSDSPAAGETQGRRPVDNVSWYDALVFANRLSILEGLSPAYSIEGKTNPDDWGDAPEVDEYDDEYGDEDDYHSAWDAVEIEEGSTGWRLPTEAQWEYAARAGATTAFSNGASDWKNEASVEGIGWFKFNSGKMTHEVGLKQPNAWGLYDIHGNVWEWCWDRHDDYPAQAQADPAGASSGSHRVNRGGGWLVSALLARSAARIYDNPFDRDNALGFRLVRP